MLSPALMFYLNLILLFIIVLLVQQIRKLKRKLADVYKKVENSSKEISSIKNKLSVIEKSVVGSEELKEISDRLSGGKI